MPGNKTNNKNLLNRRILLVRNDKVGDLVIATPAIKALRKSFPNGHISALVSKYAQDVIKGNPHLDTVIVDDSKGTHKGISGIIRLAGELRKEDYDTAVVVFPFLRTAILLILAGIPTRISTSGRWYQFLFNRTVYLKRSKAEKHEIDYALDLIKLAGAEPQHSMPEIFPAKEHFLYADEFLLSQGIKKEDILIGINPGSGLSARKWPEKNYGELSKALKKNFGAKVLIFWGPGEEELAENVRINGGEGSIVACKADILQLAALISRCSLFITNNTGPMHIAAATNVPMISIFDPKFACSPVRWGYEDSRRIVLKPDIKCTTSCDERKCGYDECMDLVTVDMVMSATGKLI